MTVYLQATIRAKTGMSAGLLETLKNSVFPIMENAGWKLLGCFVHHTGPIHTITDLWELKDMNQLTEARSALATHPDSKAIREVLDKSIMEETLVLMDRFI